MNNRFWCVTTYFNPTGSKSRIDNYLLFRDRLAKQRINLLTVEVAFGNQEFSIPGSDNVLRLRSKSVLWQKERAINYGISQLPAECDRVAWLDADLLFPYRWEEYLMECLDNAHFVQLFERLVHLSPGETEYGGPRHHVMMGIVVQAARHGEEWIPLRIQGKLPYAAMGAGWAAHRSILQPHGLYEKFIVGGGDAIFTDTLLKSELVHRFYDRLTTWQRNDLAAWKSKFVNTGWRIGYLPVEAYHLFHGAIENRGYTTREWILRNHDFDPVKDVTCINNVLEWSSDKPKLHAEVIEYFKSRKDDDKAVNG
jgi:hypothetical protein